MMKASDKVMKSKNNKKTSNGTFDTMYPVSKITAEIISKGNHNSSICNDFIRICKMSQEKLKNTLEETLKRKYGNHNIISGDGFLYARGEIPVLLTAHMDTVHRKVVEDFYEYYKDNAHYLTSPEGIGGDDRCGIYIILNIIEKYKCSVLFCEDEEIGGIGSRAFCQTEYIDELKEMKYLIELDRKGFNDAVFYNCDNDEFTKFITENTGYAKAYGSFSDISNLAPACQVAAVNLSCGYYDAHTTNEYVVLEEMAHTQNVVEKLLEVKCEQFEYVEKVYSGYNYDDVYGYIEYLHNYAYIITYLDDFGNEQYDILHGRTEAESIGKFLMKYPKLCYRDIISCEFIRY